METLMDRKEKQDSVSLAKIAMVQGGVISAEYVQRGKKDGA